jgi:hypothetical protein
MDDDANPQAAAVAAITAEYVALREEVGRCQDHRNQLFSIALAILAAIVGLAGVANRGGEQADELGIVFLLAPLLFVFLGSAYVDRGRRMLIAAKYVHDRLRAQAAALAAQPVWEWESFKKKHYEDSKRASRAAAVALDGLRGMIFVACGVISLGLYAALPIRSPGAGRVALIALDGALLLLLVVLIWHFEETRGLP